MALVARTRQGDHVLGERGSLMARCLEAGLPVASACSGRGACGKCVMSILGGGEHLPSPSMRERTVLARNEATAGQRLGCQCRPPAGLKDLLITTGYW